MNIEKLPSGSYRIREMYNGKYYSITVKEKPTKKEATIIMSELYQKRSDVGTAKNLSFEDCANEYIDMNENILSPSTINSYRSILRNLSDKFKRLHVIDISQVDVQKEINNYALTRSPKTVANANGFILTIMGVYAPSTHICTNLPKRRLNEAYMPSDEDVRAILDAVKGTDYEIPFRLAVYGLRRSETLALDITKDLDGNMLSIRRGLVTNGKEYVIKDMPKTADSIRTIYIDDELADLMREKGYVYNGHPNNLLRHLHRLQDNLGIPRFKLHAFRYYYCSMAHSLGIPDVYIMQSGGWRSDSEVMKKIYRRAMEGKKTEMQQFASSYITELLG